ncbi:hypothetical protein [Robertmurraya andreesenii]|uniref:Na+/H+ antiporter n=1 Tax=Anoxybacillus andreesenii TaxID=1325932 RepID=A0ABT9V624_9BACL|nr:hypothetical protein [Robertmurraya andreesenii]MDQ0156387.1 hypothetical protein [Robertmurraya andreesenii]
MFRFISILLIGLGGYWVLQNRFRVVNMILGNRMIRRFFVSSFMSLPFVRNQMMKTVFSSPDQAVQ